MIAASLKRPLDCTWGNVSRLFLKRNGAGWIDRNHSPPLPISPPSLLHRLPRRRRRLGSAAAMLRRSLSAAVLSLALCVCRADEIHQWPGSLSVLQGAPTEMKCLQKGQLRNNMLWYRQPSTGGLALIGSVYLNSEARMEESFKSGFVITRAKENKQSTLQVESVKAADAATYFCATSDGAQRCRDTGRQHKNSYRSPRRAFYNRSLGQIKPDQ
ncbi:uncharacterized protein [Mobula birostris]|uniref:uncharacterized protein n=1 Tax=Mobula birostris TaxID=1983395 RepID=UPI003B28C8AD